MSHHKYKCLNRLGIKQFGYYVSEGKVKHNPYTVTKHFKRSNRERAFDFEYPTEKVL